MDFLKKCFSKEGLLKFLFSFTWLIAVVFVADIVSKWAVQNSLHLDGYPEIFDTSKMITIIPNFLHIILTHNKGASFGMGSSGELGWRIFWISISVILTGVLIFIFIRYYSRFTKLQRACIALMVGGAFGNMIDRIFYWNAIVGFDGVIDWIDFQFGTIHFATFNLADSALVIGVAILVIIEVINLIKEIREKDKRGEYDLPPAEIEKKEKDGDTKDPK